MANFKKEAIWHDEIHQLSRTDPVVGGENGISNKAPKQLADRTEYLNQRIDNLNDELTAPTGFRVIGQCESIAQLRTLEPVEANQQILVRSYYAGLNQGGGQFYFDEADTTSADNGGTVIVTAGGKRWKRVFENELLVEYFGAVGDKTTDDTNAIQRAITAADKTGLKTVQLNKNSTYRITSTLQVVTAGLVISGTATSTPHLAGANLLLDLDDIALDVKAIMVTVQGINFYFKDRDFNKTKTAIRFKKLTNSDDMDGNVLGCSFAYCTTAIDYWWRGLYAHDNLFVSCANCINVQWDNATVEVDTNGNGLQALPHGMRAFRIVNNRAHTCPRFFVNNGEYAENMNGLLLTNNQLDVGEVLFLGACSYSEISNNVARFCSSIPIYFTKSAIGTAITNNVLTGHPELVEGESPAGGIEFTANAIPELCIISNNVIAFTKSYAIKFNSGLKQSNVVGNTFKDFCFLTDKNAAVIYASSSVENVIFSANTATSNKVFSLLRGSSATLTSSVLQGNNGNYNALLSNFSDGGSNTILDKVAGNLFGKHFTTEAEHYTVNNKTYLSVFERSDSALLNVKYKNADGNLVLNFDPLNQALISRNAYLGLAGKEWGGAFINVDENATGTEAVNAKWTRSFVESRWTSKKGETGWEKRPDGVIEQWGRSYVGKEGTGEQVFALAFPTQCCNIVITPEKANSFSYSNKTATGFRLNNHSNTECYYSWRAIGY